jgi:hypothetical protein
MRAKGISSSIAIAAVVVIVLIAGAGYFFLTQGAPKTSSSGTGPSSTNTGPAPPLNATKAYLAHLDAFANRTTCSFSATCVYSYVALNDYSDQSTVVWENQAFGGPRNTTGLIGIQALYQALGGIIQTMNVSIVSIKASGNQVNVVMNVTGASTVLGPYVGQISAQATYGYANGTWSITKEVWNFLRLTAPNANNPNPPPIQFGG